MTALRAFRLGPIARLSLGIVALLVGLVMVADMLLGVVPGQGEFERRVRQRVAENLAMQITSLLEADDAVALGKTLQRVLARDASILGISVRRADGSIVAQRGQAPLLAAAMQGGESTLDRVRVPISSGHAPWGAIDIRFTAAESAGPGAWFKLPSLQMLLAIGLGGFLMVYAYLRRAMHYLNPSASVPDRVRKAFDSLAEGLLIVDQQARIVLANKAFRQLQPQADDELNGQAVDALAWLTAGFAATPGDTPPWAETLRTGSPVSERRLVLPRPDGTATQLLVSSAPIADNKGRVRGCLITFDNVSAVHRANEELRGALGLIESSNQRIEEQNTELRRLALSDPMTGCFNRRALFDRAIELFASARIKQTNLCCVVIDIDHFKRFNDEHGHAVGDQVIQVVARALAAGLRQGDVLARYGGEEFCIVLPGAAQRDALNVAERMRTDIELNARGAVNGVEVGAVTVSLGVASLSAATRSIEDLIDQADQALYKSKQNGRNRVTLWAPAPASTPVPETIEG